MHQHSTVMHQHSTVLRVRKQGDIIHSNITVQLHSHYTVFTSGYKKLYRILTVQKMDVQVGKKIQKDAHELQLEISRVDWVNTE